MDETIEKMFAFLKAQQDAEEAGEEEFECPLCGGKAWWDRVESNNHLHSCCEGCGFKIME